MRSLADDGPGRAAWLLFPAVALAAAWGVWMLRSEVTLREVAADAQVEVAAAAHDVGAPRDGRLVLLDAPLGRAVRRGDVIAAYDDADLELDADAARVRIVHCRARIEAVAREVAAHERAAEAIGATLDAQIAESRGKVEEAKAEVDQLERRAAFLESLAARNVSGAEDAREARSRVAVAQARMRAIEVSAGRFAPDAELARRDRLARAEELRSEASELEGEIAAEESALKRIAREKAERVVRAPVDGVLGEASPLRVGSVVRLGQRLAWIVPPGDPRIVATFPAAAVGRVRPGQEARLRFDGFPWTRYGFRRARVVTVGSPDQRGRVPVELAPVAETSRIPLDHGLACTAEIEVETVTPFDLVLRSAGSMFAGAPAGDARR